MAWDSPLRFTLTEDHIKLLRRAIVRWDDGAPAIDTKRPYGNSDVERDIAEILDHPVALEEEIPENIIELFDQVHHETATALQVVLSTGTFEPGTYVTSKSYTNDWHREHEEQVRAAFGEECRPFDCPEAVWRMLIAAGDLAEAMLRKAGRLEDVGGEEFGRWSEAAWAEVVR